MIVSAYLSLTLFLLSADLLYVVIAGNKIKLGYFLLLGLWCFNPAPDVGTAINAVRRVPKYVLSAAGPVGHRCRHVRQLSEVDMVDVMAGVRFVHDRHRLCVPLRHRPSIDQVQEAVAHSLGLIALFAMIQFAFIYGLNRPVFDPQVHLGVYRLNGLSGWPHFLNIFSFLLLPMVVTQKALSIPTKAILVALIFVLAQSTAKTGWVLFIALGVFLLVFERRFLVGKYLLLLIPALAIALFIPFHSSEGQRR